MSSTHERAAAEQQGLEQLRRESQLRDLHSGRYIGDGTHVYWDGVHVVVSDLGRPTQRIWLDVAAQDALRRVLELIAERRASDAR